MKKIYTLFTLLFTITIFNGTFAQNANVTVSTGNTANGSWSGGTAGPYVFTPSANGAVILNTDIVNRLTGAGGYTKGNVTVTTSCNSCSEAGNITISNVITAANTNSVVPTLAFNAANNITVTANINLTGATGAAAAFGFPATAASVGGFGANITFVTSGSGSVTIDSTAAATIITTGGTGGAGNNQSVNGAAGGTAGIITINAAGTFYMKNANSVLTANGGTGGAASGGGGGGTAGAIGNANNISITGNGGISLAGNLTATGTTKGNFTINDGNLTVTTGGGNNNGQTGGVISGGNLTKTGNGTFFIGGNNTYTGTTSITAGTLRPTNNTVVASTNGPLGNNASGLYLNGGAIESNVATFSRPISITATGSRLDAFGSARTISSTIAQTVAGTFNLNIGGTTASAAAGQVLTLSGVISNSSGTLSLTKTGTSEVVLSAANTFGGGTTLYSGTLDINNASALGNVAGTFTIDSAATFDNTTGGAIATSNYPMIWNGDFTFKGTQALNLGTGAITTNANVQITTTASTLTVGGTINNASFNITKAGAGSLTFGSQAITIKNLTVNAGTLTATSGTLSLAGNFTNNATFTNNSGTVAFIGGTAQTIGGSKVTTFYNLTSNNTYGTSPQLTLSNNETVSNTLTLTQGNIDAKTNSDTLYVSNNATGAISWSSGYIIGNLKRAITNTGSPTYTYYLGTSTGYTPASLNFTTLSSGGTIIGSATSGDYTSICSSTINSRLTVNDYWTFLNSGVAFTNYGASFTYPTGDLDAGVTASKFIVGKYSGSWSYPTISGTPSTTVTSISGATTFGNYAIGDTINNKISYAGSPFCNSITSPQSVSVIGAQNGTFSAASGLSINTSTGAITPKTSTPGTYTVTYTLPAGVCPSTSITTTVTIKASPIPVITNNTGTSVLTCSTTTINVTASGGNSYAWSGGNSTATAANSFTSPNTYTLTVSGSNGCTTDSSITITQNITPPTAGITNNSGTTVLNCNTKSISLTATGGVSYVWSGGKNTATALDTVSVPNTYTVSVTGSNGCKSSQTITITQDITKPSAGITNNTGTTVLNCNTKTISVTATGGASYAWSGGDSTINASNTFKTPNTYTVTVKGSNGCTKDSSINITQDIALPTIGFTLNTGSTQLDCNNSSISITATGGSNYVWSGGSNTTSGTNVFATPDNYSVTVTGSNGCKKDSTITITKDTVAPTISFINNTGATQIDCNNASINITATGGSSYAWSGGNSTATANNTFATPNTYSIAVNGSNGCKSDSSITITKDTIAPTAGITNNTGTTVLDCNYTRIFVTANGGVNYVWSGGDSTGTAGNSFSTPGTYTVTVYAANGCSTDSSIVITQDITTPTAGITNNTGVTILDCNNSIISVTATGGASYAWSAGDSSSTATNTFKTSGTYTVTVKGNNGCTRDSSITLTQDITPPSAGITNNTGVTQLDCNYSSISLTATGGISYVWSGGDSLITANNTIETPNTYTVTVKGNNGCTSDSSITITKNILPPAIGFVLNTGSTQLDCNNASISITATGGTSYAWSDATNTATDVFTSPNTYSIAVTGSNGCTKDSSIIITQNTTPPTVVINKNTGTTQLDCYHPTISVTATGGSSYSWSGGDSTSTATNTFTSPGTYTVNAIGSNGCSAGNTITITQDFSVPTVSITNNSATTLLTCTTTSISATATGGGTYSWSGGVNTASATNTFTSPGNFVVTVTSTNGCSSKDSITITQDIVPAGITNNTGSTQLDCNNASISVTATGGTSYIWSGGNSPTSASNTFTTIGSYSVTITNSNGCNNKASITISKDISKPSVTLINNTGSTQLDCNHSSIDVTATGGGTYSWSGGNSLSTANNSFTAPNSYSVTVTGSNGCSASDSIKITQNLTIPTIGITNNSGGITQISCAIPTISLTATGGNTYVWSGGSNTASAANSFTTYGSYTVTGTAANGCSSSNSIFLSEDTTPPVIGITNNSGGITLLNCNITSINVTATGGDTYTWSGGSSTATDVNTFTTPATYTVTGTSISNGCSSNAAISITQDITPPTAGITNNTGTTQLDCNHASISVTATGSGSYSWSGGTTPSTANNTFTSFDTYSLTVTGSNGCTKTTAISITQDVSIPVITITNNTGSAILTCTTTSINVTASGAASYAWSGGITPSTASNAFVSVGTYSVNATGANGCIGSSSIAISQNIVLPTISITNNSGTNTLTCGTTAISVTAGGGSSYSWSGGNSTTTAIDTLTTTGTYIVTGTGANGCSNTANIIIYRDITTPNIQIINNSGTTLLSNEHPYIDVKATGGVSYSWSGGDSVLNAHNILTGAGTYTVTSIAANGCSGYKSIQIKQLSVRDSLTVGNDTGCVGTSQSYSFLATPTNAGSNPKYQWRINGNNAGTNSSTFSPQSLNNNDVVDVVITTLTTSVTATSNPIKIVLNPLPPTPTVIESGNVLSSSATLGNQWYLNGIAIAGATSQFYTTTQPGLYYVEVTNNGCSNTSSITKLVTGIDQYSTSNSITVYPNPFSQQTTLSLSDEVKNSTIKILSLSGATIREGRFSGKQIIIERADLQAGTYFIQVIDNNKIIANEKVIVQ
jgi:hypothetical protein